MLQTLHSATRGESARYEENVGFCVGFAEFHSARFTYIDLRAKTDFQAMIPLHHGQLRRPILRVYAYLWLFSILFHHQTTTTRNLPFLVCTLFSILFHHQTTTRSPSCSGRARLFSILFHHQTTTRCRAVYAGASLFSILFHHQTTTEQHVVRWRQVV